MRKKPKKQSPASLRIGHHILVPPTTKGVRLDHNDASRRAGRGVHVWILGGHRQVWVRLHFSMSGRGGRHGAQLLFLGPSPLQRRADGAERTWSTAGASRDPGARCTPLRGGGRLSPGRGDEAPSWGGDGGTECRHRGAGSMVSHVVPSSVPTDTQSVTHFPDPITCV